MPYWRLSGFYFFYFATLGALVPYWGLYLQSLGFGAVQIGNLVALLMVSRIVAPNIWGWLADHRGQRMAVVRWAAFLSVLAYVGVFLGTGFWWLAVVMMVFSFFWNASLPQLEAATMNHLAEKGAYGRVRLWGSIGFIISVVGLGYLLDYVATWWLLPILLLLLIGIWLYSLLIPEAELRDYSEHLEPLVQVLLRPEVFAFLFVCLLMQASHGPYYTFYSIYLDAYGYSKGIIGILWAIGVICEIAVFLLMHRLQKRVSLRNVLIASLCLAAIRWKLIGVFPHELSILILAQVLHAATFGAYHATAIEMVHGFFKGRHQIRGQAIYGSISFGVGGALGSFYSGMTWNTLGPDNTFIIASALAVAALIVTLLWIKPRT
ncbi:MAG: MFS transporter [Gammaproteobacteria bacterium]|nr:MFS transporter [Gammaproteobacteria bacterium]